MQNFKRLDSSEFLIFDLSTLLLAKFVFMFIINIGIKFNICVMYLLLLSRLNLRDKFPTVTMFVLCIPILHSLCIFEIVLLHYLMTI